MATRVVKTADELDALIAWLPTLKLPFTMNIVKGRKRSTAQNRLQRLWMNEIAEQREDGTPEEYRAYCKLHFGLPLMRSVNDDFKEKYDRLIRPFSYEEKLELMAVPMDFPVTRLMTTTQKTQYLDGIYVHFTGEGIKLTEPEGKI